MSSSDKLTIETPEQTLLEFPLAGIGSRFLAIALDTLLIWAAIWVIALIALLLAIPFSLFSKTAGVWVFAVAVFVLFGINFAYFAVFEAVWNGQTPGKRWTHLRVIKDSGRPISPYDAILRNLVRIVDALPTLYAAGLITMLISRENKRLGDYAAGTVVIHEKPLQAVTSIWNAPATTPQAAPLASSAQITSEELQLVEAYLERRGSLDPPVRWAMARQIADRVGARIGVLPDARPDSEKFLEAVAEQRRASARFR
ncbi:MAG TPA: RDD family protein [Candidatus Bathyarchaeia archaeon]|nr:RDD family protein [Candidatus Bathyarchaeia archaeon]